MQIPFASLIRTYMTVWGSPFSVLIGSGAHRNSSECATRRFPLFEMIPSMGGPVVPHKLHGGKAHHRSVALMHEVGTCRMGKTAADSVLNGHGHAWEVRNLYVADGASFVGHADKNPTHTIMARERSPGG